MNRMAELGYEMTPLGELVLRRRAEPLLGGEIVYEVKLGDEYLMSSLFTEAERQLAKLGLIGLEGELDVVVGGLGLGYTTAEALREKNVSRLLVIELFQAVIDWHERGLLPVSEAIVNDSRCELRQGDFFELVRVGLDEQAPGRKFDAVLVDIDHSPEHFLDKRNGSFYTAEGLATVRDQLKPGGCFALWSNDHGSEEFSERLRDVFGEARFENVEFPNPYSGKPAVNSVYIASPAGR